MKRLTILLAALALIVGAIASSDVQASGSGTHVSTTVNYGTVTYKLTLDGDSAKSCGITWRSDSCVYTPWVDVPVGIPFQIYVETRDADSALAFGPDTVHVGLFTAPATGLAVDSVGKITKQNKHQLLWDFRSILFSEFTQQTYFYQGPADTTGGHVVAGKRGAGVYVIDTPLVGAASLKTLLSEGGAPLAQNLGKLRFGLWMDASDSILDSGIRLNCYIIFKDPSNGQWNYPKKYTAVDYENSYGTVYSHEQYATAPEWAYIPKDEE